MPNLIPIPMSRTKPGSRYVTIKRVDILRIVRMLYQINEIVVCNPFTGHEECLCDECMKYDNCLENCIDLLEDYI